MGYQPWYVGDTYPALQIPLNVDGTADNITSLTANSFTMTLRNTGVSPAVDTTGTGTFTIVTSNPAVITYQFSIADVTTAGIYLLIIKATFPGGGGGIAIYDPVAFTLTAI